MPPKDDGGDPDPTVDDATRPDGKTDNGGYLGNGLDLDAPKDGTNYLGTGQVIRSDNGKYTLQFENGNLVEKDADGNIVYESNTKDANNPDAPAGRGADAGKVMGAELTPNGLEIKSNAYYQSATTSMIKLPPGTKRLQLNDDGSLTALGADGKAIQTLSGPDPVKHALLIQLVHPLGDDDTVLHLVIDVVQDYMQVSVDLMGQGKASQAPDLDQLLSDRTGLHDFRDKSTMIDSYQDHLQGVQDVKSRLQDMGIVKDISTSKIAKATQEALNKIAAIQDDLNDELRAPGDAKGAPDAVKKSPVDITYDDKGDVTAAKLPAATVQFLLGALWDAVDKVDKVVKSVSDDAGDGKNTIDKNSPEYKAGYDAGKKDGGGGGGKKGNDGNDGNGGNGGNGNGANQFTGADTDAAQQDFSDLFPTLDGTGTDALGDPNDLLGGTDTGTGTDTGDTGADTGDKSDIGTALQNAMNAITNSANTGTATPASNPFTSSNPLSAMGANPMSNPLLSGMNPMSGYGLPSSMMNGQNGSRSGDSGRATSALPGLSSGATNPMTQIPGTANQAMTNQISSAQNATASAAPALDATSNSMVDMKLPDGSTQKVSSVVADAVNRELNNPNGSDARAAYAGTPAAAGSGAPWTAVDSSHLRTGDVVQWADRSGLVVVDPAGLQVIVNGHMVPLDPNNPPDGGQGGYGEFRGFFHPSGADLTTAKQPTTATVSTVSSAPDADRSAAPVAT